MIIFPVNLSISQKQTRVAQASHHTSLHIKILQNRKIKIQIRLFYPTPRGLHCPPKGVCGKDQKLTKKRGQPEKKMMKKYLSLETLIKKMM